MDEKAMSLLRGIVEELTDSGRDMGGLLFTREEVVCWLKERNRLEDAAAIEGCDPFRLRGSYDGLVCVSNEGLSDKQLLHDFGNR